MTQKDEIKLPPQNLDAEKSVLGALLIDPECIVTVVELVGPDDFYKEAHSHIYKAVLELNERREPVDMITLTNELEKSKKLEIVGGRTYIAEILSSTPTSANVEHYARIVAEKAVLRKLISAGSNIAEMGYKEEYNVSDIIDKAESVVFKLSQIHKRQDFISIKEILTDSFERIDEIHKNKGMVSGTPSGFIDLDKMLGGLQRSDMIVLAARPSMGKTSLALNIAQNVAVKSNIPVGIFSLEMSKEQLVDRLICGEAQVDMLKLRTGFLSDDDFSRIGEAMGILGDAPIYIDDTPGINSLEMRTKARKLQAETGIGLLIIDYLQLMSSRYASSNSDNRVQEVSEISRAIKGLARELHIPVIAVSQLSRAVEQRQRKIPLLSDLRESGSIEQDADVVMFIYREDYYNPDCAEDEKNIAQLHIAKHRNGPTGEVKMYFKKEQTRFISLAKEIKV